MRVKYNRVSTLGQTGNRFEADTDKYDLVLLDKVSGTVNFRDRENGRILIDLAGKSQITEIVVEEISRLGRNTRNVLETIEFFHEHGINVVVRNMGLQSRPNGETNPIWKVIITIIASLYEQELNNLRERIAAGKLIARQRNVRFGRPTGSNESEAIFINKSKNKKALEYLRKGRTLREIGKLLEMSTKTVQKVKKVAIKLDMM
ncbi:DNA invertase Pin-like site-specific DNA recombinase [Chryseobacterium sp. SORGH_AS 447]|uniref:recombinase family protein n=1 Tax=Chryseobacterium sp. SORGH_AS_0447 TaxID=3041769 RepID=UPI00277E1E96|nr:recombinase family protein [Chryseobacterium sp. SORGH_AS_0447]MDQ1160651.1 DNA invertase Pin-like site-specific DNA recombinase [Chryseobacterium sp. SORGH_AS_0447]